MAVHIDTLNMVVRRLSNQMPVRYYLCAGMSDNPYSHMRIELWWLGNAPTEQLHKQLENFGFTVEPKTQSFELDDGVIYIIRTYVAERDWTPQEQLR